MSEIRIVDPTTGGEKCSKAERFDLIPSEALEAVARVYGTGSAKYSDRNWERGYRYGLSFAALMRHAWAWWRGEDTDNESGESHLAHVAWHALTLMTFRSRRIGTDDRSMVFPVLDNRLRPLVGSIGVCKDDGCGCRAISIERRNATEGI